MLRYDTIHFLKGKKSDFAPDMTKPHHLTSTTAPKTHTNTITSLHKRTNSLKKTSNLTFEK